MKPEKALLLLFGVIFACALHSIIFNPKKEITEELELTKKEIIKNFHPNIFLHQRIY